MHAEDLNHEALLELDPEGCVIRWQALAAIWLIVCVVALSSACGGKGASESRVVHGSAGSTGRAGDSNGYGGSPPISGGTHQAGGTTANGSVTIIEPGISYCIAGNGSDGAMVDTFPLPPYQPECEPFEQPGTPDPSCPTGALVQCDFDHCLAVDTLQGCCRADGTCGLFDQGHFTPGRLLGCIRRDAWIENAEWLGSVQVPVTCNP